MDGHARANQHKASGIAAKELILRVHLVPILGTKRLDAITNEDVQRLKGRLSTKAPKTVNNVITVLNTFAQEGRRLGRHRCDALHGHAPESLQTSRLVLRLR